MVLGYMIGCSTTEQGMKRANDAYVGKNVDEFMLRFGPPQNEHKLNNGNVVYQWILGGESYGMPATTSTTGYANSYGGYSGYSTTYGGGSLKIFCDLQVQASSDGTIISINALRDTIGAWETSRCAEIFK